MSTRAKQPKYIPKPGPVDHTLEWASAITLILSWFFALFVYAISEDQVAIHFNAMGNADSYGNKIAVVLIPLISTALFIGMTLINRRPDLFNYPVKITPENLEKQYTGAMRLIRGYKLVVVLIFLITVFAIYISGQEHDSHVLRWLLPAILVLSFLPLVIYFSTSNKRK